MSEAAAFSKGMSVARRRRFGTVAALALAGALLAGCNSLMTAGTTGPNASIVGGDLTAGPEEHARIVAAYGGIYHDDKLERTVARIVGRVVACIKAICRAHASRRPKAPTGLVF